MGIVAAGTIDLMASPGMDIEELGICREAFLLGQRLGRTSNIIFTLQREVLEGDSTNEILIAANTRKADQNNYQGQLLREFTIHLEEIRRQQFRSFSSEQYAEGFVTLHQLQASLVGRV
jgi:hypothetical protein